MSESCSLLAEMLPEFKHSLEIPVLPNSEAWNHAWSVHSRSLWGAGAASYLSLNKRLITEEQDNLGSEGVSVSGCQGFGLSEVRQSEGPQDSQNLGVFNLCGLLKETLDFSRCRSPGGQGPPAGIVKAGLSRRKGIPTCWMSVFACKELSCRFSATVPLPSMEFP